jgi:hypothetical protein
MLYQVTDLLNRVRDHVGESRNRGTILNPKVIDYLGDAQNKITNKMRSIRSDFILAYQDVTLNGSLYYDLPRGVSGISYVEDITNGENSPSDMSPIWFEDRFLYVLNQVATSSYRRYSIQRNKLLLPDKDSGGTVRVWYPFLPKKLLYFTASSSTDTTVVSPSSVTAGSLIQIDDYYNGMFLLTDDGQFREVTDFVGSTRSFTVDADWDSNPSATTVVSLCSPIWPEFQDLIHLEAGKLMRSDLDMGIQEISIEIRDRYNDMEKTLRKYTSQKAIHVKKVGR